MEDRIKIAMKNDHSPIGDEELQRLKQKAEESHSGTSSRFTMDDADYSIALIERWFFASAEEIYQEKKRLREEGARFEGDVHKH